MRTILQAVILFSFISAQAQLVLTDEHGNSIADNSTVIVTYDPTASTVEGILETNLSSDNNNDINVRILETNQVDPAVNFFCSVPGYCFPPTTVNTDIALLDNNTIGLSFHYQPNETVGDVTIKYRLADVGNNANDIVFYVTYMADASASVVENFNSVNKIEVYPNPANQEANIVYNLNDNSELILYNILGVKIENYFISRGVGSIKIKTANLESGTYIYQIITESNIKSTKYLIVNH